MWNLTFLGANSKLARLDAMQEHPWASGGWARRSSPSQMWLMGRTASVESIWHHVGPLRISLGHHAGPAPPAVSAHRSLCSPRVAVRYHCSRKCGQEHIRDIALRPDPATYSPDSEVTGLVAHSHPDSARSSPSSACSTCAR